MNAHGDLNECWNGSAMDGPAHAAPHYPDPQDHRARGFGWMGWGEEMALLASLALLASRLIAGNRTRDAPPQNPPGPQNDC